MTSAQRRACDAVEVQVRMAAFGRGLKVRVVAVDAIEITTAQGTRLGPMPRAQAMAFARSLCEGPQQCERCQGDGVVLDGNEQDIPCPMCCGGGSEMP